MSARILVVDDEAEHARTLSEAIASLGYEVVVMSNGREGLHALRSWSFDGILLDLEMPVMNGWTMLDELRWQGSQVPVIVMSQEANGLKLRTLLEEGAQDYLVKPINRQLLQQKFLRHFSWRRNTEKRPVRKLAHAREVGIHEPEKGLVA